MSKDSLRQEGVESVSIGRDHGVVYKPPEPQGQGVFILQYTLLSILIPESPRGVVHTVDQWGPCLAGSGGVVILALQYRRRILVGEGDISFVRSPSRRLYARTLVGVIGCALVCL